MSGTTTFKFAMKAFTFALALAAAVPARADGANIFAAASLKGTMEELASDWQAHGGNGGLTFVYGGSSQLARQIENGAPASIFISADMAWMDEVESKNLLKQGTRFNLAGNALVLIGPAGSAAIQPDSILEKLGQGKLAVGDVKSVPAGKYAKAALTSLGIFTDLESHLVQTENVRAAMDLVAAGEAAMGIVYTTDARAEARVAVLYVFHENTHPPIIYPAAGIAANLSVAGESFLAYLKSQAAQDVLEARGFVPLNK